MTTQYILENKSYDLLIKELTNVNFKSERVAEKLIVRCNGHKNILGFRKYLHEIYNEYKKEVSNNLFNIADFRSKHSYLDNMQYNFNEIYDQFYTDNSIYFENINEKLHCLEFYPKPVKFLKRILRVTGFTLLKRKIKKKKKKYLLAIKQHIKKIDNYLLHKIKFINDAKADNSTININEKNEHLIRLFSKASDTALIEYFFAMRNKGELVKENGLTPTKTEVIRWIEITFNRKIKDWESKYSRAKNRKKNRTPNIDALREYF